MHSTRERGVYPDAIGKAATFNQVTEMFEVQALTDVDVEYLLAGKESHFLDYKSKEIAPSKLTKTLSALANADGGEVYLGIRETTGLFSQWDGFTTPEEANAHIQCIEKILPFGVGSSCTYLFARDTYVVKIDVRKSLAVVKASDDVAYLRRGPQNLPQKELEELERLKHNKGIQSYENMPTNAPVEVITESETSLAFIASVVPKSTPDIWLKKQQLITNNDSPVVAGVLLFADEPQAILPKRCGIKVYRYKTSDKEGIRENLASEPVTIEGCLYNQIFDAVALAAEIVESIQILGPKGLENVSYPREAIHEVITNAVIHRDYSIPDDVHIRIFDNRIEVTSPGLLPAHISVKNILEERFARNGAIVRLINKFPNPPNKDIGEGLNTAYQAMRSMRLADPVIEQNEGAVIVTLKHERLATYEDQILQYLRFNASITNSQARAITFIGSENKLKRIFQRMMKSGLIERVPEKTRYNAAYRLKMK